MGALEILFIIIIIIIIIIIKLVFYAQSTITVILGRCAKGTGE